MIRRVNLPILIQGSITYCSNCYTSCGACITQVNIIINIDCLYCCNMAWEYSSILYRCLHIWILNEKKICIHIQVANLEIYTRMYIYIYVRVCIHNMYICIPARRPRNRCVGRGTSISIQLLRVSREILHRKKPSDPKWRNLVVAIEKRRETKRRDIEAKINSRSFAPATLGAFSSTCYNYCD